MKLPTNAHTDEINSVAGINTDVATITGFTKLRRRNTCTYAASALRKTMIVSSGTVCSSVTYGRLTRDGFVGRRVRKRMRIEQNKQMLRPVHHSAVQTESLYFRRPRVT